MMGTYVTSVINQEEFLINKGEENEIKENIYVLSEKGLIHASVIEIFEDNFKCKADKTNTVKINDIVITE
ncbi:hypothetical protein [Mammaliicoccus stepanovicii]|uniref:Uncharacterized protein n=1 Tax=Mammaliicoccus stepanovicii TaxID=643214 RepID=A0A239ZM63_9STAP|nr:hypothetical protein [Mammaliicoccus stepanovicii]PNZ79242.1 hypothetical protein CD111_00885 [Mammaliicoccus stepanovicii]GGI41559.1 hypothetical protein GCM10010896_14040 [Mammaliicoccus stepanovicii]SNV71908.1 Uncharacterised protein [Mammaliicoccus stepanovicii]